MKAFTRRPAPPVDRGRPVGTVRTMTFGAVQIGHHDQVLTPRPGPDSNPSGLPS